MSDGCLYNIFVFIFFNNVYRIYLIGLNAFIETNFKGKIGIYNFVYFILSNCQLKFN